MVCPRCKAQIPQGAASCPKCGVKFTRGVYCPHCRAVIPANSPKCPKCGKNLKKAGAAPAAGEKPKKPARWWFWGICGLLVLGILGNLGRSFSSGRESAASPPPGAASSSLEALPSSPSPSPTPLNLLLAANVHVNDVMNGAKTEKIGQRAHINMRKSDAKAASMEEFTAFVQERVRDSGYNWYSILFEDGTGICFPSCSTSAASYGEVDEEGCVVRTEGDIYLASGTKGYTYAQRTPEPTPTSAPRPTPAASPKPAASPESGQEGQSGSAGDSASGGGEASGGTGGGNNFDVHDNPDQQQTSAKYVLNTSSMKFHYPSCNDVKKIAETNYATSDETKDALIAAGYSPCGHCIVNAR